MVPDTALKAQYKTVLARTEPISQEGDIKIK